MRPRILLCFDTCILLVVNLPLLSPKIKQWHAEFILRDECLSPHKLIV